MKGFIIIEAGFNSHPKVVVLRDDLSSVFKILYHKGCEIIGPAVSDDFYYIRSSLLQNFRLVFRELRRLSPKMVLYDNYSHHIEFRDCFIPATADDEAVKAHSCNLT